jgi:hypothetical protein
MMRTFYPSNLVGTFGIGLGFYKARLQQKQNTNTLHILARGFNKQACSSFEGEMLI